MRRAIDDSAALSRESAALGRRMNVGGVPLGQHPHGFWWVMAAVAAVTVVLDICAVRRLGPRR